MYAHTSSGEVSYTDTGQGPVALFLHGVGTSSHLWRHVIAAVAGERRCVALDLPGHGNSPVHESRDLSLSGLAELVDEFCAAVGLTQVDLVANDTGGAIAQVFAASHPTRLRTLTLTNCEVHDNLVPPSFRPIAELAKRGELAPSLAALASDLELARTQSAYADAFEHPELVNDDTFRAYLQPAFGTPTAARNFERLLASALADGQLVAIEADLAKLDVPTLIVWGTGDDGFELRWAYWLRDTIQGATEVIEIEGAKLFFPDERPEDLVPHLRRHWTAS